MALIPCSECGNQISTKAAFCPHCGAPPSLGNDIPTSVSAGVEAPPPRTDLAPLKTAKTDNDSLSVKSTTERIRLPETIEELKPHADERGNKTLVKDPATIPSTASPVAMSESNPKASTPNALTYVQPSILEAAKADYSEFQHKQIPPPIQTANTIGAGESPSIFKSWNYIAEGKVLGPVDEKEIINLIRLSVIHGETPVWTPGMPMWSIANTTRLSQIIFEHKAAAELTKNETPTTISPVDTTPSISHPPIPSSVHPIAVSASNHKASASEATVTTSQPSSIVNCIRKGISGWAYSTVGLGVCSSYVGNLIAHNLTIAADVMFFIAIELLMVASIIVTLVFFKRPALKNIDRLTNREILIIFWFIAVAAFGLSAQPIIDVITNMVAHPSGGSLD